MKKLVTSTPYYSIWESSLDNLYGFIEFVVLQNYLHHVKNIVMDDIRDEINSIYQDELKLYENSKYFIAETEDGEIIGAIRLLKWNGKSPLPTEKIFGKNILFPILNDHSEKTIWHVGRFAVTKKGQYTDNKLFKILMICAIKPICEDPYGFMFAESDRKLLKIMLSWGIQANILGSSINYLGSETIPICVTTNGLKDFYNRNNQLLFHRNHVKSK